MAFNNPFTVVKLKTVKASMYNKILTVILKEKLADGEEVPFSLIMNHVYAGFDATKSAKAPFLLLGKPKDGNGPWKKFRDGEAEGGGIQKDFMAIGTCTRQGTHLMLTLDKSKGVNKIPNLVMTNLKKVIKNANPAFTIGTKEGENTKEGDSTGDNIATGAAAGVVGGADAVQGNKPKTDTSDTKEAKTTDPKGKRKFTEEQKEKITQKITQKFKEEKQAEAIEYAALLKDLNEVSSSDEMKKVSENLLKGRTTEMDLEIIKKRNRVISEIGKLNKKTAKQVQEKFSEQFQQIKSQKKNLVKSTIAVAKSQLSLKNDLLTAYYKKTPKKDLTEQEINTYTEKAKKIEADLIAMNEKRRKRNLEVDLGLLSEATLSVIEKNGVENFQVSFVNKELQKRARENANKTDQ